jgi:glycosyltransferase involved in cell wall biosynthesis
MTRIAIFHDNFAQMGGAERVADALAAAFPKAALHTTLAAHHKLIPALQAREIVTTWMQRLPKPGKYYRHYFLLYPLAVERVNLRKYDLVVTSCFGYAKGVRTRDDALHVCYCHTPMRWVWRYDDYVGREKLGPLTAAILPRLIALLRQWDLRAATRPHYFIANSSAVAARIRAHYRRDAVVIPPPIEVERFRPLRGSGADYLVVARLAAYKRIDLAIEACNLLRRPLTIIGEGPDRARLERLAGPTVTFRGRVSDDEVVKAIAECRALLFPGEEDFGMAPLEANAAGRPVIAWKGGGALDTVREYETGVFFDQPTAESLAAAIERSERHSWDGPLMRKHAAAFDRPVFTSRVRAFLRAVAPSKALSGAIARLDDGALLGRYASGAFAR